MYKDGSNIVFPIIQGEYHVSDDPEVVLSTVLGSCVAVCMYDPVTRIGGMNHFLLPGNDPRNNDSVKYGVHLIELLTNALMRKGVQRNSLQVKLLGGANSRKGFGAIGTKNAKFARERIKGDGFNLVFEDLGGDLGRRVRYVPVNGGIQVQKFPLEQIPPLPEGSPSLNVRFGNVELF